MALFASIWRVLKDAYLSFENKILLDRFIFKFKYNNYPIFTPNVITILRTFPGFAAFHIGWSYSPVLGVLLYAISFWGDRIDGAMARRYLMITKLGKYLDPGMDKLVNIYGMIFFLTKMSATLSSATLYSVAVSWLILAQVSLFGIAMVKLYVSTGKTTLYLTEEGANIWGKVKTVVECIAVGINLLLVGTPLDFDYLSPLYGAAGVLAVQSAVTHIKQIKKRS